MSSRSKKESSIIDANQEQPATRKLHKSQMKCKCCNIARDNSNRFHKVFNPNSEKVSKLVIWLNKEKTIHICQFCHKNCNNDSTLCAKNKIQGKHVPTAKAIQREGLTSISEIFCVIFS